MDNRAKKVIIFLIILTLLVSIVIIMILKQMKTKEENIYNVDTKNEIGDSYLSEYAETINDSISIEAYFDIVTASTSYLNTINKNNNRYYIIDEKGNYDKEKSEEYFNNSVYNILSEIYKKNNNITKENIKNKIKFLSKDVVFIPLEAKSIKNDKISSFLVHGLAESIIDYKIEEEVFFIINIDASYNTFSIEPIYEKYKSIDNIKISVLENTVIKNENNIFTRNSISLQAVTKDYMNIYKRLALGAPQILYNKLNEEYNQKRFGSLDNFKKYIEENKESIKGIRVEEYLINDESGYTQYVAKDQYENMYIFNEIATLNYNIILDTYTLEQPKFTKEYNAANNQKKVMMNIDKFFQMINNKDYTAAYNSLADSFKQNYFKTEESFKNYIKKNLYNYNKVTYANYNDKTSGVYGYELIVKDKQNTNNSKTFNIVMKLKTGTDFEMSFEV